jgi:hypothetical protein
LGNFLSGDCSANLGLVRLIQHSEPLTLYSIRWVRAVSCDLCSIWPLSISDHRNACDDIGSTRRSGINQKKTPENDILCIIQ